MWAVAVMDMGSGGCAKLARICGRSSELSVFSARCIGLSTAMFGGAVAKELNLPFPVN